MIAEFETKKKDKKRKLLSDLAQKGNLEDFSLFQTKNYLEFIKNKRQVENGLIQASNKELKKLNIEQPEFKIP